MHRSYDLVRMMGLEPIRSYEHEHLKLACLPIPAHARINHLLCLLFKVVSHKATYQKHRHGVRVSPVGGSLVRIHVYDFGVLGESRTRNIVVLSHARLPIAPREHKRATICFRTTRCSMGQPLIFLRS